MKKRLGIFVVLGALLLSMAGCSTGKNPVQSNAGASASASGSKQVNDAAITVTGENYPLKVKDFLGAELTIDSKPQRVAVLSGTPMNIWYDLGGKSICTSDVSANLRITEGYENEIKALPPVGQVYSINVEAVVAQKPDFIIAQSGTQTTAAEALKKMGFKVIQTSIKSYQDVIDTYRAFGKLLGASAAAEKKIAEMEAAKSGIVKKIPDKNTSVAILYVTSKSIAVKLNNSIAGDIAAMLKLKNIASNLPPDTIGSEDDASGYRVYSKAESRLHTCNHNDIKQRRGAQNR